LFSFLYDFKINNQILFLSFDTAKFGLLCGDTKTGIYHKLLFAVNQRFIKIKGICEGDF